MQLQLYRSEIIIKKSFAIPTASSKQYILPLPAVTTANSTIEL